MGKIVLSGDVPLLSSQLKPARRLHKILPNSVAVQVTVSQIVLRVRQTICSRPAVPRNCDRFILRHALGKGKHTSHALLRFWVALLR